MSSRKRFLVAVGTPFALALLVGALTVSIPPSARADCIGGDATNYHTNNSIYHGWTRNYSCVTGNYTFHVWTNHGHGSKYVALWHDNTTHLHCDDYVSSGSSGASCSDTVGSTAHYSWHVAPSGQSDCRYSDGHGVCGHGMESLP